MSGPLSRRRFLAGSILGAVALAGCAAAPGTVLRPTAGSRPAGPSSTPGRPTPSPTPGRPTPSPTPGRPTPSATADPTPTPDPLPDFRRDSWSLATLSPDARAYGDGPPASLEVDYPVDDLGLPVSIRGGQAYRHPVQLLNLAIPLVETYRRSGNDRYLERAIELAHALLADGDRVQDTVWFRYGFAFSLHGKRETTLDPPWYSGMAQGMALSLFVRLGEATGDPEWTAASQATLASIAQVGTDQARWVSRVDGDGFLWIEEYPGERPDRTLNGFLFALFGLFDLAVATGDQRARTLLDGGLTAIRHYLPEFRVPGSVSRYCLAHGVQNEKYHGIHVWQLEKVHLMTGDAFFADMSSALRSDA